MSKPNAQGRRGMTMSVSVTIEVGPLAEPLGRQLEQKGIAYNRKGVAALEKDLEAVHRLKVRGYLNDQTVASIEEEIVTERLGGEVYTGEEEAKNGKA